MNLLTGCYRDPDPAREAELEVCREANAANPLLRRVILFVEKAGPPKPARRGAQVFLPHGRRETFADLIDYANRYLAGQVVILANADIAFDDTLALLNGVRDWTDLLICLSRTESNGMPPCWDFDHYGESGYHWAANSQDAWIFKAPIRPFSCNWPMGVLGCDNRLAHEAAAAGLRLVNPFPEIRAWHHHRSRVRRRPQSALPGPYRDVPPERLLEVARP